MGATYAAKARLPFSPAASRKDAIDAARPTLMVITGDLMCLGYL